MTIINLFSTHFICVHRFHCESTEIILRNYMHLTYDKCNFWPLSLGVCVCFFSKFSIYRSVIIEFFMLQSQVMIALSSTNGNLIFGKHDFVGLLPPRFYIANCHWARSKDINDHAKLVKRQIASSYVSRSTHFWKKKPNPWKTNNEFFLRATASFYRHFT